MLLSITVENTGGKPRVRICERFESAPQGELSKTILVRGPGSQFTEDLLRLKESRNSIEEIAQAALELERELQKAEAIATL